MNIRPLTRKEVEDIIGRNAEIVAHQPKCPSCNSDQVQIVRRTIPAGWKCRECRSEFTSEPRKDNAVERGSIVKCIDPAGRNHGVTVGKEYVVSAVQLHGVHNALYYKIINDHDKVKVLLHSLFEISK